MKIVEKSQKKRILSVLSVVIALTVLCLSQLAFSQAGIIGSWQEGTSHSAEGGTNRALIFIVHAEHNAVISITSAKYGGEPMDPVIDEIVGTGWRAYAAAYILNDAGISDANNSTFEVTWNTTPTYVGYSSVFLENVDQTDPNGAEASNSTAGSSPNPITTSALATNDGDMVILGATAGNGGSYVLHNGFTEGNDQAMGGTATGVTGYKAATGAAETPSAEHNNPNRQVIIGFVVQGAPLDPNIATHPNPGNGEDDVLISTDLSWDPPTAYTPTSYDVYFGTDTTAHNNPEYTVDTNSYDPMVDLEYGTTYYWAVDSNDAGTIHPGNDWNFSTVVPVTVGDRVSGNMILLNDNGGWCWYQDDKIIYDPVEGNILTSTAACWVGFGGVGGTRTNDMDATTFNIATGNRTRSLQAEIGGDDHNMGAFWIRPDGRYLHLYCPHYSNPPNPPLTYYRLSTNPNDGSAWNSEQSYNWSTISGISITDGGQLTYTNVHYMSGEGTSGRLYNIVRWNNTTPNIAYSDDEGATWDYMGKLNDPAASGYSNYYHKFRSNGVDRIDFIGCEQHPRNFNNSVFHGYIKNGKGYDSYGNVVDDNLYDQDAPSIQAYTPIFIADSSQILWHTGWTNELELDKDGYPVCLYQTRYGTEEWGNGSGQNTIGAADHRFFYARFGFDGTQWKWTSTELGKMGAGLHLPEQDYIGMGCIHPDDANIVYIATPFDPRDDTEYENYEIFKGVTYDRGLTWNWTQITFDSTEWNVRPAIPSWDANNTAVVWTRGSWNQDNYEQYDLVVVGIVEEEDVTLGLVSYIDATESNTEESDGTPFEPNGPSGSAGAANDQWHEYTGYGNGGSCYTAGETGDENAPTLKTTISGLSDGTYDVFAYMWCDPEADWGVRGGFEPSEPNMLCFSKQSSQHAEASQFSGSVVVEDDEAVLYRVYIGRREISDGASIDVYIDDYDGSYDSNPPDQTTYDGVGVASVIIGGCYPGDLNCDEKVNLIDIAVLGQDWLDIYNYDDLAEIADNWLYGT